MFIWFPASHGASWYKPGSLKLITRKSHGNALLELHSSHIGLCDAMILEFPIYLMLPELGVKLQSPLKLQIPFIVATMMQARTPPDALGLCTYVVQSCNAGCHDPFQLVSKKPLKYLFLLTINLFTLKENMSQRNMKQEKVIVAKGLPRRRISCALIIDRHW